MDSLLDRREFLRRSFGAAVIWAGLDIPANLDLRVLDGLDRDGARRLFQIDQSRPGAAVFPQGVASGDPQTRGIVLWTRIEPGSAGGPGGGGGGDDDDDGDRNRGHGQERRLGEGGDDDNPGRPRGRPRDGDDDDDGEGGGEGGGRQLRVAYEIAQDPSFARVLVRGVTETDASRDFTVKVQVTNQRELRPFETYYFRFVYRGTTSNTGRFKTLPRPEEDLPRLRFGYVSCQDYTNGYYHALQSLSEEELDVVFHLGDYIYETGGDPTFQNGGPPERQIVFPDGKERAKTLRDYRFAYKTYKSDRQLQLAHERFAFVNIWDDHEFANDCYMDFSTDGGVARKETERRGAANQAWAEYTPIGEPPVENPYRPGTGALDFRIYRSFVYGKLAEFVMTDERLYRDAHPCGEAENQRYLTPGCPNRENPNRTMLGRAQRDYFVNRITSSGSTWKFWGNETMVMQLKLLNTFLKQLLPPEQAARIPAEGSVFVNLDQWDGYPKEREYILRKIREAGVKNFVIITGDLHSFVAGYVKENFDDPTETPEERVGTCYMGGSVTSSTLSEIATFGTVTVPQGLDIAPFLRASNPHIKFFSSNSHGYNIAELTPRQLTVEMKEIAQIKTPAYTPAKLLQRFVQPRDQNQFTGFPDPAAQATPVETVAAV